MSRVMIVDEHTIVRDGLAAILTRDPQFEIVGAAGDGDAAVTTALSARPDVVLIDLDLPGPETPGLLAALALPFLSEGAV